MDYVMLPCQNTGFVSDGYHTFNDLYEHRIALFLALARAFGVGWRSKLHEDGTMFPRWFIAGMTLPTGATITYHLPLEWWWERTEFLDTYERAPAWDGHTPRDVVYRLQDYIALQPDRQP